MSRPRSLNAINPPARPHSCSLPLTSMELETKQPDYHKQTRLSVVDMTVPARKGVGGRQRSVSDVEIAESPSPAIKRSGKFASNQKRGTIAVSMFHSKEEHTLTVHVIHAVDLPPKRGVLLDSFVRLSLKSIFKHKARAKYLQSKVVKKTCNPIYDERFVFGFVYFAELLQTSLKIKVLHRESFTRNELVGEALVPLSDQGVVGGATLFQLLPKAQVRQSRPQHQSYVFVFRCLFLLLFSFNALACVSVLFCSLLYYSLP